MSTETLWRYTQASRWLGIPQSTLRGLVHRRQIPFVRVSERLVLFDPEALRTWVGTRAVEPVAKTTVPPEAA